MFPSPFPLRRTSANVTGLCWVRVEAGSSTRAGQALRAVLFPWQMAVLRIRHSAEICQQPHHHPTHQPWWEAGGCELQRCRRMELVYPQGSTDPGFSVSWEHSSARQLCRAGALCTTAVPSWVSSFSQQGKFTATLLGPYVGHECAHKGTFQPGAFWMLCNTSPRYPCVTAAGMWGCAAPGGRKMRR